MSVIAEEHLSAVEPRKDIDAHLLGNPSQPTAQTGCTDHIATRVVHVFRRHGRGQGLVFGQIIEFVAAHGGFDGTALSLVIGYQGSERGWFEDGPAHGVCTDFSPLVDQGHLQFQPLFPGQLHQTNGSGQPGRTAAHNQNIKFYTFTFSCHLVIPIFQKSFEKAINPPIWSQRYHETGRM